MFLLHSRILEETKQKKTPNKLKKKYSAGCLFTLGLQCFIQGQRVILPQENKTALFSHAACAAAFSHPGRGAAHGEEERRNVAFRSRWSGDPNPFTFSTWRLSLVVFLRGSR